VIAIVCVVDCAVDSHCDHARHPAELQELEFLSQDVQVFFIRIGDSGKRQGFFLPVIGHLVRLVRADRDDLRVTFDELVVILAQLRKMPAADWSPETAQHDDNDILVSRVISKMVGLSGGIDHVERGRLRARGSDRHAGPLTSEPLSV
jgi:hypothetical protein